MDTALPIGSYCAGSSCALELGRALDVLAGRWSVPVMEALHFAQGPLRFNELRRCIPGISQKELARHLARLVEQQVVQRRAAGAGAQAYELSAHGLALLRPMQALGEWARATAPPREPGRLASWLDPLGANA